MAPRAWLPGLRLNEAGQREAEAEVQLLGYVLALDAIIAAAFGPYASAACQVRAALVACDPTLALAL